MRALFFQLEGTLGPPEGAMRAQKVGSEVASEVSGAHLPALTGVGCMRGEGYQITRVLENQVGNCS